MNKSHTNWKEVKLGDIGNIITGSTPPTKNKEYFGNDCLFITPTDYKNCNKYISNSERGISLLGIEKLKNRLLPEGSVMVTCIATMGKVLINKLPAITNQQINSIIVDNKKFSADFIYYLLIHNSNKIKSIVSGSAVPILNKKDFSNLIFEIPPLTEQKRIASILSSFDDKIELNNKTNKILEEMAQTIFEEWFINFNFPNANGKPYKKSGGEMIGSELGGIPKGWKIDIISNLFNVTIGKTPPRKEIECFSKNYKDIKWVSISDMGNSGLFIVDTSEYLTPEAIKKYNVNVVPKNTVILSFKLTIGRVSITSEDMTTNEAIAHFNSDNNFINEYLYFYLKNFNYRVLGNTSSIAEAINSKIIKSIKIIIPKDDILNKYHNIVFDMFKKIRNNQIENQKLSGIRDSLLPKLMAGAIRIDKNFETINF